MSSGKSIDKTGTLKREKLIIKSNVKKVYHEPICKRMV